MKACSSYTLDFFISLVYVLFGYLFCWLVCFNNIETIFLFEVYPLLSILPKKRFILTQITQLFNIIWYFSIIIAAIISYPLAVFKLKSFLTSGYYAYQIKLYNNFIIKNLVMASFIYILIHFHLIPNLISFFLYWEISNDYSLLRIEAEISLYFYLLWSTSFKFILTFTFIVLNKMLTIFTYIFNVSHFYIYFLKLKKVFIFNLVCLFFLLTPPELVIQILIICCTYVIIESFFFCVCMKYLIKNAYIKTNIKKTP